MSIFRKVTINSIKRAKVRSAATFVGIVLATCILVAITSLVFSLNDYINDSITKSDGDYHFSIKYLESQTYDKLLDDDDVEYISKIDELYEGTVDIGQFAEDSGYESPEIAVQQMQVYGLNGKTADYMGIEVYEGRLPKNSNEVIICDRIRRELGEKAKIGNTIKFLGFDLKYNNYYMKQDYINGSTLYKYKIVGFFEEDYLPYIESYIDSDIIPMFTMSENINSDVQSYYYINLVDDNEDVQSFLEKYNLDARGAKINEDLAELLGKNRYKTLLQVFLGFSFVYVIVIVLACLLLGSIFSISCTERLKQYGLLTSVGATKKQIKGLVLKEVMYIALFAIPVGVLISIIGLKGIVYLVIDKLESFTYLPDDFKYAVSPVAIVVAIGFVMVIIFLGALKSLIKVSKLSPVEAIKQSKEMKVKRGQVIEGKLAKKFGVEGTLASKYFKANKVKYRTTIASLVISIVLFLVSVAIVDMVKNNVLDSIDEVEYSVLVSRNEGGSADEQDDKNKSEIYDKLKKDASNVAGVDKIVAISQDDSFKVAIIDTDSFTEAAKKYIKDDHEDELKGELPKKIGMNIENLYLDNNTYMEVLREAGITQEEYESWDSPKGIMYNVSGKESLNVKGAYNGKILKEDVKVLEIEDSDAIYEYAEKLGEEYEPYYSVWPTYGSGLEELSYSFDVIYSKDDNLEEDVVTKPIFTKDLEVAGSIEKTIIGVESFSSTKMYMIYPESCRENLDSFKIAMISDKDNVDNKSLDRFIKENNIPEGDIENISEIVKTYEVFIFILQVFAYTLVIVASLIAIANVFNIITTNIYSRKRDFAMVQSIGLPYKSIVKMMIYECIIYGLKAISTGGIIGLLLQWLICKSINVGSVIIVIFVVFTVVFISMLYAVTRLKNNNIIETLKDESM